MSRRYARRRRHSMEALHDLKEIADKFRGRRKKGGMKKKAQTENKYVQLVNELKRILKQTGIPKEQAIIGGGGLLGAMNLRDVSDLDVQLPEAAFTKLQRFPGARLGRSPMGSPMLTIRTPYGEITFFTGRWFVEGRDFAASATTKEHRGMKHWDLPTTLDWKRRMGRDKDKEDIGLLGKRASFLVGFLDEIQKLADGESTPLLVPGRMLPSSKRTAVESKLKDKPLGLWSAAQKAKKKVEVERPKGFQRGFTHKPPDIHA